MRSCEVAIIWPEYFTNLNFSEIRDFPLLFTTIWGPKTRVWGRDFIWPDWWIHNCPPPEFTNMTIAGKSTMWSDKKCISCWTWGIFQPVMLANSGMYIFYQFDESGSYRWRKNFFPVIYSWSGSIICILNFTWQIWFGGSGQRASRDDICPARQLNACWTSLQKKNTSTRHVYSEMFFPVS